MKKTKKDILVATTIPRAYRDALLTIATAHERKIAAELRLIVRRHIVANGYVECDND